MAATSGKGKQPTRPAVKKGSDGAAMGLGKAQRLDLGSSTGVLPLFLFMLSLV